MSYLSEVLVDSPGLYLPLQELSGTSAEDASGNGRTGTYANAPTLGEPGPFATRSVKVIKTSSQRVTVAAAAGINVADAFTLEAWIRRNATAGEEALIHMGSGAAYLRVESTGKLLLLRANVAGIGESTSAVPKDEAFHHVVVTKNGETVRFYVDGANVTGTITNSTCVAQATEVKGIGGSSGTGGEYANLNLAHVAVYAAALSEARVKAHFAAGVAQPHNLLLLGAGT